MNNFAKNFPSLTNLKTKTALFLHEYMQNFEIIADILIISQKEKIDEYFTEFI